MSTFEADLMGLVKGEVTLARNDAARGDPDRYAVIMQLLTSHLATVIAFASGGNPKWIDELCAGAELHLHEEAVARAPMAAMFTSVGGRQ